MKTRNLLIELIVLAAAAAVAGCGGASDEKVDHWLRQAAPVEGFVGFAIGRSIWWDALKGFLDDKLERGAAAEKVADNYLRFVKVYEDAESAARV